MVLIFVSSWPQNEWIFFNILLVLSRVRLRAFCFYRFVSCYKNVLPRRGEKNTAGTPQTLTVKSCYRFPNKHRFKIIFVKCKTKKTFSFRFNGIINDPLELGM
jgi:hypothetical protein